MNKLADFRKYMGLGIANEDINVSDADYSETVGKLGSAKLGEVVSGMLQGPNDKALELTYLHSNVMPLQVAYKHGVTPSVDSSKSRMVPSKFEDIAKAAREMSDDEISMGQ